jgi:hypothetical protein
MITPSLYSHSKKFREREHWAYAGANSAMKGVCVENDLFLGDGSKAKACRICPKRFGKPHNTNETPLRPNGTQDPTLHNKFTLQTHHRTPQTSQDTLDLVR